MLSLIYLTWKLSPWKARWHARFNEKNSLSEITTQVCVFIMLRLLPISFSFFKFYVKYVKKVCGNGLSSVLHGARWLWFESHFCHLQADNCGQVTQPLCFYLSCGDTTAPTSWASSKGEVDTYRAECWTHTGALTSISAIMGVLPLNLLFLLLPTSDTNVNHSFFPVHISFFF